MASTVDRLQGRVATILSRSKIAINKGEDVNLAKGMKFTVYIPTLDVLDPVSGVMLGKLHGIAIGRGKIEAVHNKFALASVGPYEGDDRNIQVNDLVVFD